MTDAGERDYITTLYKHKQITMKTLNRLLAYMGRRKALLPVAAVLSALSGLAGLAPYVFIWLTAGELLTYGATSSLAITYAWWAAGTAVAGVLLYFGALMCSHLAAFRVESNIRKYAMRRVIGMPLGFFDGNTAGRIRKIIDDNAGITHSFLAHQLPDLAGTVLVPVATAVLIAVFDWRLGLACLIPVFAAMGIMAYTMNTRGREFMKQYMTLLEQMNTEAVEYVRGIPVVKVFQQTVFSFKNFYRTIMLYNKTATHYTRLWERPMTLYTVIINSFAFLLVPVAIILTGAGEGFTTVMLNLILFVLVTPVFSECVMKSMYIGQALGQAREAVNRLDELTSYRQLPESSNPKHPAGYDIRFDNVVFSYGRPDAHHDRQHTGKQQEKNVLDGISFTVRQGTRTALVGASGSGKTTIARLVARFYDVCGGSVKIGGADVRDISHEELMRTVSFVFQNPQLFKTTILENIRFGKPDATLDEVNRAADMARCRDIINRLPDGLNTMIGAEGTYLSGGERQRIALARAFLKNAPVIVLDEATAYADPENEHLMRQAIKTLTEGKTVITIAHRLTSITDADEILVIDNGRIAERGTHDSLTAHKGIYHDRWNEYLRSVKWEIRQGVTGKHGDRKHEKSAGNPAGTHTDKRNGNEYAQQTNKESGRDKGLPATIRRRFALSEQGAKDFCKGVAWTTVFDIALMLPAVFIFIFLDDRLGAIFNGTASQGRSLPGCRCCSARAPRVCRQPLRRRILIQQRPEQLPRPEDRIRKPRRRTKFPLRNRQHPDPDQMNMKARQAEVVLPRMKMRDPLLFLRIMHMDRNIVKFKIRPCGAGQDLRFKGVAACQEMKLSDVADRIGAEPALTVADFDPGLNPHPEIGESSSEPAGVRNVRPGKVPAADHQRKIIPLQEGVEPGNVLRIVLSVGVDRNHVADLRILPEMVQRRQNCRALAEIAAVAQNGDIQSRAAFGEIRIGGSVIDHQHVREDAPGARGDAGCGGGIVVRRNDTPDSPEIHASAPFPNERRRA